jgi:nucleoside 2-deoxyribosyltransferase
MKLYLSGKVSGLADLNKPKFAKYEEILLLHGWEVFNPHSIAPPTPPLKKGGSDEWAYYMRHCIKALMDCDIVAVLDDWQQSRGAMIEVQTALDLGMQVVTADKLILDEFHEITIISKEVEFEMG